MTTRLRTYRELRRLDNFMDRYHYLALRGSVGDPTFGFDRYINQQFYRSTQWRNLRRDIIVRDLGCDLGVEGYEIHDRIIIHHMNPITVNELVDGDTSVLDPEFLICVTHRTHNAIHYGDENQLPRERIDRQPGDTLLWSRS